MAIETFENPATSPDGLPLYTDVALIGDRAADRVLLANSATHGVEGFCGSGCMVGWLCTTDHRQLPSNLLVVLVHAINPYGFAWLRRVNEDNVDLNRNFVTHRDPYPATPQYHEFHSTLVPRLWNDESVSRIKGELREYASRNGTLAMQAAICSGQYQHPDGVFYGGRKPTWSNRTFRTIVKRYVGNAQRVVLLDFHTGLGRYGVAELICARPPDEALRSCFGEGVTSAALGDAVGPSLSGTIGRALCEALPGAAVDSITIEYGTYELERVFLALLADNWLHLRGDVNSAIGRRIKKEIRACAYPDQGDWKQRVFVRACEVMAGAIVRLAPGTTAGSLS